MKRPRFWNVAVTVPVSGGVFLAFVAAASAQQQDTVPPQLVSESLSTATVDVTAAPATLTMTLTVTDDLSGTSFVCAQIASPSGKQTQFNCGSLNAGTPLNGTWKISFSIPKFVESGTWNVSLIELEDRVTNLQTLNTNALIALGAATMFNVVSNPDVTPPQLTSFNVTPSSIDVSSGANSVTLTMGLQDSPSGVRFSGSPGYAVAALRSPSGKQFFDDEAFSVTQVSGTSQSGVWSLVMTLPQDAESGTWSVAFLTVFDNAGNIQTIYSNAYCASCTGVQHFESLGFVPTFTVTSKTPDTTPPVLTGLTITPFVNTSLGPATVTVNLSATDDLTGLDFVQQSKSPNLNAAELEFKSPSGHQTLFGSASQFKLLAGTALEGTWQIKLTMPQFSEGGDWQLTFLDLRDAAGNFLSLTSPAQIQSLGLPTDLEVILPSLTPDGSVGSAGGTVQDTVFGPRAALTLPPGGVTGTTTVSLDVFSQTFHVPLPSGFSVAGTDFLNVQLTPEPQVPLPLPGATITLPTPNQMAPGTQLTLFKVDPASGTLICEPSVFGGCAVGTVDASGTSATFSGLAALSVVVGLVPSAAVLGDVNGDGKVDCTDLAIVKAAFGTRTGQAKFDARADVNNNGVIDVNDLAFVSRHLPTGMVCH